MNDAQPEELQAPPANNQSRQETTHPGLFPNALEQPLVNRIGLAGSALRKIWKQRAAQTTEQSLARGIWYLVIGTWAALAVVAVLAIGTNQSEEPTRRAWIVPRAADFEEPPIEGKAARIKISFDNTGFEPAFDVKFVWDYIVVARRQIHDSETRDVIEGQDVCHRATKSIGSRTAYPSGPTSKPVYSAYSDIDGQQVNEIASGGMSLMIYGCFLYETAGEVRHSAYCYYSGEPTKAFSLCPFGNEGS
jgi:hypothetical protein